MDHKKTHTRRALILAAAILVIVGGGSLGIAYVAASSKTVYTDQASIQAPTIELSATTGGSLRALNVAAGQTVAPDTVVAQVGVELIKATQGGLVIATHGDIGDAVAPGQPVVEMIDPQSLRVVGRIDENKGLNRIQVGDPVSFTVDAFGGKKYTGTVDEVAPTSDQSGVVFNISDQRQVQQFSIKARFDTTAYPELKNGMSARMYVYVK
jgi:multidrug resistance efflux pump